MLNASRCTNQSALNNLTPNGGFDGESFQKQQTISNCFLKYCCFHCFWCCCSNLHLKVPDRVLPQGCPSQWYWFAGRFCPQPYSLGPISVSALYVGQKTSQSFQTNFADKLWTEVARITMDNLTAPRFTIASALVPGLSLNVFQLVVDKSIQKSKIGVVVTFEDWKTVVQPLMLGKRLSNVVLSYRDLLPSA